MQVTAVRLFSVSQYLQIIPFFIAFLAFFIMIGSIRLVAFPPTVLLFLASKGVLLDLEVVADLELFET